MICRFFRQTATDGALLNNFELKSVGVFDPRCRNSEKQKKKNGHNRKIPEFQ